jgi:hypothetical protein
MTLKGAGVSTNGCGEGPVIKIKGQAEKSISGR